MELKIFNDTNKEIKELRTKTFVEEKNVPKEIEFDGRDADFLHFCLYDKETLVACARINAHETCVHAGRVAVQTELRGKGYGRLLFEYIENYCKESGYYAIELGAIETAVEFYKKIGFEPVGEYFMEAGCPHINMIKKFE